MEGLSGELFGADLADPDCEGDRNRGSGVLEE
jgi:hypothetical protein